MILNNIFIPVMPFNISVWRFGPDPTKKLLNVDPTVPIVGSDSMVQ